MEDYRKLLNDPELADVVFIFPGEDNQNCSSPPPAASPRFCSSQKQELKPNKSVNIQEKSKDEEKEGKAEGNERYIYAHRNILVSRCKLFSAMFRTDMKESRNGEIIISNISYDAFYSVLEYLYSGQLFASPSDLLQILQSSDLYQLPHLKRVCERKLKRYPLLSLFLHFPFSLFPLISYLSLPLFFLQVSDFLKKPLSRTFVLLITRPICVFEFNFQFIPFFILPIFPF